MVNGPGRAIADDGRAVHDRLRAFVPTFHLRWLDERPAERWLTVPASLLYADVSGFTSMSERLAQLGKRGAEETNELIDGLMEAMVSDCATEGGDVVVFAGDAVIALFEGAHHTTRAARAAHGIRSSVTGRHRTASGVSAVLRVSSGIYSGDVLLARTNPGYDKLVLLGPAVTALCAAEGAAAAGQILVSQGAAGELGERYLGEAAGPGRVLRRKPAAVTVATGPTESPMPGSRAHDGHAHVLTAINADHVELLGSARTAEHRQVAVAFIEYNGVDALLAAAGPAAVVDAIDAISARVRASSQAHGVHVIDTDIAPDGGRYYVAAGAPTSTEFDEENLLRMTLAVVAPEGPLPLRAGATRGRVFAGDIGAPERRAYTCLGDTVNLAARLCTRAPSRSVLVTRDLLEHVDASTLNEPLSPITVKGKHAPIETAVVRSVGEHRHDVGARGPGEGSAAPVYGRDDELARLACAALRAIRGDGNAVVVTGEPGIGKSRLIEEVYRDPAFERFWADADPYQVTTPYALVQRVLRPLFGLALDADDAACARRLGELAETAVGTDGLLPLAARAVGASLPVTPEITDLNPSFLASTLHRVVVTLLATLPERPRVVVVDDVQWADEASLELLAALTVFVRGRSWLLCIGTRDDWAPAGADRVQVAALTSDASAALARALVGDRLTARDRRVLADRGGGNPLFLSELAIAARESGTATDLPASVESLLMTRIDRLAVHDRTLLRDASVLGTRIDAEFLARVLDDPAIAQPDRWAPLLTFVEPDGDGEYRFRQTLGREAAYEGLPYRRRRAVHARIGHVLETEIGGGERHTATMALHFAAAGDHERGWSYGVKAGDLAAANFANADAAASYERSLREVSFLVGVDQRSIAAVEERFGDVCDLAGLFEEATLAYRRARRRVPAPRLLRKIGAMYERVGEYDTAHRFQRRALAELRDASTPDALGERALVHAFSAGLRYRQGDLHGALALGLRAAVDARAASNPQVLARATLLLELVSSQLGLVGKAVEMFQVAGDLNGEADARNNRGIAAYYRGDWQTALAEYEASGALFARTGDVVGAATAQNNIGEILCDQGRFEAALERFDDAAQGFGDALYAAGVAIAISNVGRALARSGDHDGGLAMLADALERFRALDAGAFVIEQHARRIECLLLAGRQDDAAKEERDLDDLVADTTLDAHTRTAIDRLKGWAALLRGDLDGAAAHLATSLEEAAIADARYERAFTLLVIGEVERARTGGAGEATREAWSILDDLGVVAVAGWPRRTAGAP